MPLAPPCISSSWPSLRCAVITRFDQTVQATSGSPAASMQVDAGGNRHHLAGRNGDVFGVAAAGQQSADLLPRRPFVDAVADRCDDAGDLHAR